MIRKRIVSNFLTADGFYEGKDKSLNSLYGYYHEDYSGDDRFESHNAERMREANFLRLSRKKP